MILLLFLLVSLCLRLDLLNLMDINITTCLQFWLKPFKIWPLHLLHQEVEVKIMVMVMVMLIFLLDLLNLMVINITTKPAADHME